MESFLSHSATTLTPITFNPPTAAYIHIPFCRRRCFYCDFAISVVGDRPPLPTSDGFGTIVQYVEVLCQEIAATPTLGQPLTTVFFGGGTPSLLTVAQLEQILSTLDRHFGITSTTEISIEMDPGTFDLSRLQGYRAAGINRVSLGVQAFQTDLLAACGRTHTAADIDAAIDMLHQVNLTNFSLDLISGLPHQTLEMWSASLQRAIDLTPPHLSIYDLTVEPGTTFDRWYTPGCSPLPTDEMTAQFYRLTQQTLTQAGYRHYEISNYARLGYECRHNCVYWNNQSYYGFGMGAASYVNGQRFTRPRKRGDYFQWVEAGQPLDCAIAASADVWLDTLMVGLRLAQGLSLAQLTNQFGAQQVKKLLHCLEPYQQKGWLQIDEAEQKLRLTDPEGFLFSNIVLATVFECFETGEVGKE